MERLGECETAGLCEGERRKDETVRKCIIIKRRTY